MVFWMLTKISILGFLDASHVFIISWIPPFGRSGFKKKFFFSGAVGGLDSYNIFCFSRARVRKYTKQIIRNIFYS